MQGKHPGWAWALLLGAPAVVVALGGFAQWLNVGAPAPHAGGWPEWATATATGVLALAALVTLVFVYKAARVALAGLEEGQRTRHGQLLVELQRLWTEKRLADSLPEHRLWTSQQLRALGQLCFDRDAPNPTDAERAAWMRLELKLDFMEIMGALAAEQSLTSGAIYRFWGGDVLGTWAKWEDTIRDLQRYEDDPDIYRCFEDLAKSMKDERAKSSKTETAAT